MENGSSRELTGSGEVAPAVAWRKFTDLVSDPMFAMERSPDEFVELLEPFLTNPARHARHVRMIVGASQNARMGLAFKGIPGFGRLLKRSLRRVSQKQQFELHNRLKELEEDLTSAVQPADIALDILPLRGLETPQDWASEGRRLQLVQIKVGVMPRRSLTPASLSVRLQIDDDGVQFEDCLPRNEFEELGTQEVTVSEEGKLVATNSDSSSFGAAVGGHGLSAGAKFSGSDSTEVSATAGSSRKMVSTPTVPKIQSQAIGTTALWQLLASEKSAPTGGLDFYASFLVTGEPRAMQATVEITADFDEWGSLRVDRSMQILVAKPATT